MKDIKQQQDDIIDAQFTKTDTLVPDAILAAPKQTDEQEIKDFSILIVMIQNGDIKD